jgi:hypothetical protein
VRNDKGEKIGKTDDFIVKSDGPVTLAIIDVAAPWASALTASQSQ